MLKIIINLKEDFKQITKNYIKSLENILPSFKYYDQIKDEEQIERLGLAYSVALRGV